MLLVSWDGLFYRRFAHIGDGAWNTGHFLREFSQDFLSRSIVRDLQDFSSWGVSWAVCWLKETRVWDNLKRRSDIIELKMMIISLKVNYNCQSGRKHERVGFYAIWYAWPCELRWWASPPQLDLLGPWIFLIVPESTYEGGVKSALGVGYASYDLISVYGFLPKDLWIFPGWASGLIHVEMLV